MNETQQAASKTQVDPKADAPKEDDRGLVERAKEGDRDAFRALFEKYHRRVYAIALGVVKNPQDAQDVLQDAFVKVHKHIGRFEGSSSFYTWLYRIVMNLSIDHVRRGSKRKHLDYDDQVGRDNVEARRFGPQPSLGAPDRTLDRKELAIVIQEALQTLPEHHRAVIVLREIEGLSYEEIANVLEVPKGTIMSRLFHARKKMQEALSPYVQETRTLGGRS